MTHNDKVKSAMTRFREMNKAARRLFDRLVMRLRGLIGLLIIISGFIIPLYAGLRELPWRWVADEYVKWWDAILVCIAAIRTGERQ